MGLRGKGATRLKRAKEEASKLKRRLPWQRKGLSRVDRVVKFLQWLPITKGILEGKRMRLLPGQRAFIEDIYGHLDRKGRRTVTLAIKSEPKGNGKTGLVSGLALCHLLGPEAERRGEVYSAAIDRQQAGILFNEMEAIILGVPEFAARVNIQRFHKKIEVLEGDGEGSLYEALSADARRAHGLAPTLWIYDELAQAKERTLLDNLMEGMGKRSEALGIVISTQAPSDEHPLSQLIDDGLAGADPTTIVHLKAAPEDADPYDEATIRACNEAYGKFLNPADLAKSAQRAQRMPAFEPAYLNLRLNRRVDSNADSRLVTKAIWTACGGPVDQGALEGRRCYGGLDLSGKRDLTALVLAFPDDEIETRFDLVSVFWTPEDYLAERRARERDLFKLWIDQGHIIPVPGPVIRTSFVARKIAELSARHDIRAIGYDRWRIDDFRVDLAEEDAELHLEPFGQGFRDMAPAIEHFAELALTARLRHGGHPVLTACIANAITVSDPAGNLKIDKERSNTAATVRIDGAVAAIMALGTAKRFADQEDDNPPSVYESAGFFI